MSGILYGVGVGPGDPELLTLKAVNAIKQADIIIAPKTEKKEESSALSIARAHINPKAQIVYQVFPMLVENAENQPTILQSWNKNKDQILEFLQAGQKVAFLTLGDPMLYSTYMYVFKLLEGCEFPIITIPGITSFCAIASELGIPLAEKKEILSIVPATAEQEILEKTIKNSDNLALMKVYKNFDQILKLLEESDHLDNAFMISKYGLEGEKIFHDLKNIQPQAINYLSTIIAKRDKKNS